MKKQSVFLLAYCLTMWVFIQLGYIQQAPWAFVLHCPWAAVCSSSTPDCVDTGYFVSDRMATCRREYHLSECLFPSQGPTPESQQESHRLDRLPGDPYHISEGCV